MKLLVHVATDRVVGAQMVGPDAAEIMQGIAIAFKCGATKAQFDSCVGIHPSAAEEFVTMSTAARWVWVGGRWPGGGGGPTGSNQARRAPCPKKHPHAHAPPLPQAGEVQGHLPRARGRSDCGV